VNDNIGDCFVLVVHRLAEVSSSDFVLPIRQEIVADMGELDGVVIWFKLNARSRLGDVLDSPSFEIFRLLVI
jgi:hypothetical protein